MTDPLQATIAAAVNDVAENGFSAERMEFWQTQLRNAAMASLVSLQRMEEMLREALIAQYRASVESGKVLAYHPGVGRLTLAEIEPRLRHLLDQRIVASANLIKLNRQEAVEKTLRRFAGWSTSIPPGGSDQVRIREKKAEIRKSMAALPFEERRVLIDQQHKLTAAIDETIARGADAIGGIWRSHWRQAGYDYREAHKERDGKFYMLKDNWAQEKGLVKPGRAGYYDNITKVGEEVFCRCNMQYVYNLRSVPSECLTRKGEEALAEARRRILGG